MNRIRHAVAGAVLAAAISFGAPSAGHVADSRLFAVSDFVQRDRFSDEIVGRGPDIVFIPGLVSSRATWLAQVDRLKAHYRLHLVQVAGFAGEKPRANAAGEVLVPTAEAIDAYLVEKHIAPAVLIGHSLGGTMALYLAEHHGEHLKKVLLVDALPFYAVLMGGSNATVESTRPRAEALQAFATRNPDADKIVAGLVSAPRDRETVVAWGVASDAGTVNHAMADDLELDLRPGLAAVTVPVTLLYPDYAPAGAPPGSTDLMYKTAYAALPAAKLLRVDNSRHFIMLDQPAAFDAALDAFLKG